MDSRKILKQFYLGASPPGPQPGRARHFWSRVGGMARYRTWHLVFGSLAVSAWIVLNLYYYNLLVDLEYNTRAAWSQVEAQLQRRSYIQQNLTQIVIDYSQYEKELLTRLTKMRTSVMGGDLAAKARDANQQSLAESSNLSPLPQMKQMKPSQLDKLFSNILLVAEQYPQLKLTENFQQFSEAIIDTENRIAEWIMKYNEAVNTYTTTLTQFPGNVFGAFFGFPTYEFYIPDEEVLNFQPVEY